MERTMRQVDGRFRVGAWEQNLWIYEASCM